MEGTNNTWVTAGGAYGTSNQVNWLDSTSNTFYITGIQLELGSATPFEHRTYADELIRCERYYQNSYNIGQFPGSSTAGENSVHVTSWGDGNAPFCNPFRTVMRAAPTVTLTVSATSIAENAGSSLTLTATLSGATDETVILGNVSPGTRIVDVTVKVSTPVTNYSGSAPSIEVGTNVDIDAFATADMSDLSSAGSYTSNPDYVYPSSQTSDLNIQCKFTHNGATLGAVTVVVTYV